MKHGLEFTVKEKDGKLHTYRQETVTTNSLIEWMELTPEKYPDLDQPGWIKKDAEFIAKLYSDKKITKNFLLEHINSWDWDDFVSKTQLQLIGADPKKVEPAEETEKE